MPDAPLSSARRGPLEGSAGRRAVRRKKVGREGDRMGRILQIEGE